MKKYSIITVFTFALTVLGLANAFGAEYKATILSEVSSLNAQISIYALNNKDQILGSFQEIENGQHKNQKIFISDKKTGILIIELKDKHLEPIFFNNSGQIVGYVEGKYFLWSKTLGFHFFNIPSNGSISITGLNDLGQIIGHRSENGKSIPFVWDNGTLKDMGLGSEFAQHFEKLGFYVMDISLTGINNKGELMGSFTYGKYHEKKKKYIAVESKSFFWNGDIHFLPNIQNTIFYFINWFKLNNNGTVLGTRYYSTAPNNGKVETYLWSVENGLICIPDFQGTYINDSEIVQGLLQSTNLQEWDPSERPAIWNNGTITTLADLLEVKHLHKLAPPCSDTHEIESIYIINSINNKGKIAGLGSIWSELYPCLLEPVEDIHK